MIDAIMTVLIHSIVLIFSIVLYVFLTTRLVPGLILKPRYNVFNTWGRGLKKFSYNNGRAIVYEPNSSSRKYILQYILSSNGNEKYIKCKIDKRISSLRYDVVAIDSNDKEIDTISINDPIAQRGVTFAAMLPQNTSYVSVFVKEVNGYEISSSPKMIYSLLNIIAFGLITVVLTVIEMLLMKSSIVEILDLFIPYSNKIASDSGIISLIISAIIGALLALLIFLMHSTNDTKIGSNR